MTDKKKTPEQQDKENKKDKQPNENNPINPKEDFPPQQETKKKCRTAVA